MCIVFFFIFYLIHFCVFYICLFACQIFNMHFNQNKKEDRSTRGGDIKKNVHGGRGKSPNINYNFRRRHQDTTHPSGPSSAPSDNICVKCVQLFDFFFVLLACCILVSQLWSLLLFGPQLAADKLSSSQQKKTDNNQAICCFFRLLFSVTFLFWLSILREMLLPLKKSRLDFRLCAALHFVS